MECREHCGACCIAPGISQSFYGMPGGKPPGVRCVHLDSELRCCLFNDPRRPGCCSAFKPERAFCGDSAEQALEILAAIEETRSLEMESTR